MNDWENKGEFLEEYINPKKSKGKYILYLIMSVSIIYMGYVLINMTGNRMSAEELKTTVKLFNIESEWVENGKIDDEGTEKIILVPTISFKIKNIGKKDLSYMSVVGVFRFLSDEKFLGEGNKMVLKDALKPNQSMKKNVKIISDRGYRASSVKAFIDNEKEWKRTFVDIFVKLGGYKHVKIKRFNISRKIKGMNLNVKISKPNEKRGKSNE